MKHYHIAYIVTLTSLFQLHAMKVAEKPLVTVTGKLYIDGPIAYGPEKYYGHFNSYKIGHESPINTVKAKPYEPLIQVGIVIKDKDKSGNDIESPWTDSGAGYVCDHLGTVIGDDTPMPHIIKAELKQAYRRGFGGDDKLEIPKEMKYEINHQHFPSYLPVRLFKENKYVDSQIKLFMGQFMVLLQCVAHPEQEDKHFQDNLQMQLKSFIAAPLYFKWRHDTSGSTTTYQPIKLLMEKGFIKTKALPESILDLILRLCQHEDSSLCPRYCSSEQNEYEHGKEGIKVVKLMESDFSYFLMPQFGFLFATPEEALEFHAKLETNKRRGRLVPGEGCFGYADELAFDDDKK